MKGRFLIPEDETIVVLDTSPARSLAHEARPEWLDAFIEMSSNGYSFSLAETTASELIVQYRSSRISNEEYSKMINLLSKFLNPAVPIIPGNIDLELIIGIQHEEYNINETDFLSLESWRLLLSPSEADFSVGPPFEQLVEEERQEWIDLISDMANHIYCSGIDILKMHPNDTASFLLSVADRLLDSNEEVDPPLATRMNLELLYRFRQIARTTLTNEPYNPRAKKKRNDGVDVNLYRYLILPALIVAEDRGFFNGIEDLNSFQREWFFRPL